VISQIAINKNEIFRKIKSGEIQYAGNIKLNIYGLLSCASGKRMRRENRVFFKTEKEALSRGFRPCGHCLNSKYQKWRTGKM